VRAVRDEVVFLHTGGLPAVFTEEDARPVAVRCSADSEGAYGGAPSTSIPGRSRYEHDRAARRLRALQH